MALTIEVTPDVEQRIRQQASLRGIDPGELAMQTLREHVASPHPQATTILSVTETALLQIINQAIPESDLQRREQLLERARHEELPAAEQADLRRLIDLVEVTHARRIQAVVTLAQKRGVLFEELMDQLGFDPTHLLVGTLKDRFGPTPELPPALNAEETDLLRVINAVLPDEILRRYQELKQYCREETLTDEQHPELLRLLEQVEGTHASRLEAVLKLAQRRGVPFTEMMEQLGLVNPGYE